MDKGDQQKSLAGLEEITKHPVTHKPANFDEWLLQKFGEGLSDVFMRKYNRKIWTVDTKEMNCAWVGERVAVPDVDEIKAKIKETDSGAPAKDSEWGPNRYFRYPKYNGTGGVWEAVARQLPSHWLKFYHKVTAIDIDKKVMTVEAGSDIKYRYTLGYDTLISTVPLDVFTASLRSSDLSLPQMQELASQLVFTHTHIVGVGLTGQLPKTLADKSWVYFPDADAPFYRVTMFSNYSDDHVPKAGSYWSLMCEIAEPKENSKPGYWSQDNLVKETIKALVLYGFITADLVVSKHYRRLDHGYPVPSIKRDMILDTVQPWLKSKDIYSRGRFGGWRYEVANQDHSFMQGVEAVDKVLRDVQEITYPNPDLANSKKATDRVIPLYYEVVISQYNENLDWVRPFADHALIYHKGNDLGPAFQCYGWERLPNVGRESHTYLHHIITNYDQLADVTVFLPGKIVDHKRHCFQNPSDFVSRAKRGFPCKTGGRFVIHDQNVVGKAFLHKRKNAAFRVANMTFAAFYSDIYERPPPPKGVRICWKACVAATRAMIRRHSLDFYKRAISHVDDYHHQEESHYFERLWYHIFRG